MYSKEEFAVLELVCREVAELAKREMEYSRSEYWLAEAEEWKQLKDSAPSTGRTANRSNYLGNANNHRSQLLRDQYLLPKKKPHKGGLVSSMSD
jgi:hypothetical protein